MEDQIKFEFASRLLSTCSVGAQDAALELLRCLAGGQLPPRQRHDAADQQEGSPGAEPLAAAMAPPSPTCRHRAAQSRADPLQAPARG
jgi:hypothetical protein